MIDIIKEYLASVGFAVDKKSFDEVNKSFSTLEQTINKFLKKLSENKAFAAFSQKLDGAMAAVTARIGAVRLLAIGAVAGIVAAVGVLVVAITAATATFMSKIAQAELSVQKLAISLFTSVENARSLQNVMKAMDIKSIEDLKYVNLMPEQREQFMSLRKLSMELAPSAEVKQGLGIIRSVGYALQRLQMTFGYLFQSIAGTLGQIMKGPLKDLKKGIDSVTKFIANHMPEISDAIASVLGIIINTFIIFARLQTLLSQIFYLLVPLRKVWYFIRLILDVSLYFLKRFERFLAELPGWIKGSKEQGSQAPEAKQAGQGWIGKARETMHSGKTGMQLIQEAWSKKATPETKQAGQKLVNTVKVGEAKLGKNVNQAYVAYARKMAEKYALDPNIFVRQLNQESGFNPKAKSSAGAMGIGQLMPSTAKALGVKNPYDPYENMEAAARHMADLKKRYGSIEFALAAYNGGGGAVDFFRRKGGIYHNPNAAPNTWANQTGGYVQKIMPEANIPNKISVNINVYGVKDPELAAEMVSRKLQTALNSRNLQGAYA